MRYFEWMESGLPSESFIVQPPFAALPNAIIRVAGSFPARLAWKNNRKAGEKLTWRGRSFVEAFAEVNRREIAQATLMDLPAGGGHVAVEGWRPGPSSVERYHFICQTSDGTYIRIGEERITPKAGELASTIAFIPPLCAAAPRQRAFVFELRELDKPDRPRQKRI